MAVWPSQFCPVINSFQEAPPDNIIRTSMDKGPDIIRRRTTANTRPISFRLVLSKSDVAVLDAFYVTDTLSGSEVFDYVHPRTGQSVQARFVAAPSYQNRSTMYEAQISLEIMP